MAGAAGRTLGEAAGEFLAREDLDAATLRSYGQTLTRLCRTVGERLPLAELTAERVAEACATAWGDAAARTWNRHVSAIRSFSAWVSTADPALVAAAGPALGPAVGVGPGSVAGLAAGPAVGLAAGPAVGLAPGSAVGLAPGLAAGTGPDLVGVRVGFATGLGRRPEVGARTAPLAGPDLDGLWERADVALRERTLWRLLHESGATVRAVLALNVEELDLADRRGRSGTGYVSWRSGTARLLPELLAGRARGPVFLADRRPGPGRMPAEADRCPETGRGRLSYERAEYLFKRATGATLRRLKPR
nr:site-specific integrase [Actinoplanes sp. ATCC 53533]